MTVDSKPSTASNMHPDQQGGRLKNFINIKYPVLAEIQRANPGLFISEDEFTAKYTSAQLGSPSRRNGAFKYVDLYPDVYPGEPLAIKMPRWENPIVRQQGSYSLLMEVVALDRVADVNMSGKPVFPRLKNVAINDGGDISRVAMELVIGRSGLGAKGYEVQRKIVPTLKSLVAECHQRRVFINDLKPSDIVVRAEDDIPVIVDFGSPLFFPDTEHIFDSLLAKIGKGEALVSVYEWLVESQQSPVHGIDLKPYDQMRRNIETRVIERGDWREHKRGVRGLLTSREEAVRRATEVAFATGWSSIVAEKLPALEKELPVFKERLAGFVPFFEPARAVSDLISRLENETDPKSKVNLWLQIKQHLDAFKTEIGYSGQKYKIRDDLDKKVRSLELRQSVGEVMAKLKEMLEHDAPISSPVLNNWQAKLVNPVGSLEKQIEQKKYQYKAKVSDYGSLLSFVREGIANICATWKKVKADQAQQDFRDVDNIVSDALKD